MTFDGKLEIFVNGASEGIAATDIPLDRDVWAVVDMYGTCQQISIVDEVGNATGMAERESIDEPVDFNLASSSENRSSAGFDMIGSSWLVTRPKLSCDEIVM